MVMTYPYVLSEDVKGTSLAWEGDTANAFSFIASCGYKGIELLVHQPEVVEPKTLSGMLKENSLHAVALGTGLLEKIYGLTLVHQKEHIRKEAVVKMKRTIDIADKLGAAVVIGRFRGRWKHLGNLDLAESYFHKALEQLLPYAQKRNVSLMLEPQSELSSDFINTIDDALKWVEKFPELNLVFDTFHMDITEPNMLDALKKARDKIGLLHIADTDRKVPGEGSIDFMNIFYTLKEIGFEGPCSFEIRQNPDQATVCLKAIQSITKYFTN